MAFTIITQGSFTSTGVGVKIPLPSSADYFRVQNLTQIATTQTPGRGVEFEWYGGGLVAADNAIETKKADGTDALNMVLATSGGFTYVVTAPTVEAQAANAITGITAANPAVVTQTQSYSNGDILRIYNTTGDLTIGGMTFEISSNNGTSYTLLGLANLAAVGLAAATAGNTRRVSANAAVDPEFLYVTGINPGTDVTASPIGTIVSTSVDPSRYYVVGMRVRFSVPSSFGMTQIDGLTGTITALNVSNAGGTAAGVAAYNMVVDIDSSSFTAFAFPVTTLSPSATLFATVAPAGARTQFNTTSQTYTGYNFDKQPFHTGQFTPYMFLAAGAQSPAGSENDVIVWQAYKMEATQYS